MADDLKKHFDALWQYTLAAYKREGVPATCLALQDRYGLDVNVLFLCLFAGARGHELPTHEFALIDDIVAPWKEGVIHPLRSVRRLLKARIPSSPELVGTLYRNVLTSEIKAEEHEHYLIATTLRIPAGAADDAITAVNLVRYFRLS
ncbi:MAG: TIGR02444 family protein, partial [Pusillimonas sp.]